MCLIILLNKGSRRKFLAQKTGAPLVISFLPRTKTLQRLMGIILLLLHVPHSSLRVTFFVVFAFFLKIGLVWPPKPFCLASYLLFPWAFTEALPVLYWETLWTWCFLHFWQWVLLCLGVWTYGCQAGEDIITILLFAIYLILIGQPSAYLTHYLSRIYIN